MVLSGTDVGGGPARRVHVANNFSKFSRFSSGRPWFYALRRREALGRMPAPWFWLATATPTQKFHHDAIDTLVYLILGVAGDGIKQPKVHYVG